MRNRFYTREELEKKAESSSKAAEKIAKKETETYGWYKGYAYACKEMLGRFWNYRRGTKSNFTPEYEALLLLVYQLRERMKNPECTEEDVNAILKRLDENIEEVRDVIFGNKFFGNEEFRVEEMPWFLHEKKDDTDGEPF